MILSPSQRKVFADGLAACQMVAPQIEWLRQIIKVAPEFKDRVQEVIDMTDHHEQLCTVALAAAG